MRNTIQSNKISTTLEKVLLNFQFTKKFSMNSDLTKKNHFIVKVSLGFSWIFIHSILQHHVTLNTDTNSLHHDSHMYQKTRRTSATVHPVHAPCKSSSTQSDAFLIITGWKQEVRYNVTGVPSWNSPCNHWPHVPYVGIHPVNLHDFTGNLQDLNKILISGLMIRRGVWKNYTGNLSGLSQGELQVIFSCMPARRRMAVMMNDTQVKCNKLWMRAKNFLWFYNLPSK